MSLANSRALVEANGYCMGVGNCCGDGDLAFCVFLLHLGECTSVVGFSILERDAAVERSSVQANWCPAKVENSIVGLGVVLYTLVTSCYDSSLFKSGPQYPEYKATLSTLSTEGIGRQTLLQTMTSR